MGDWGGGCGTGCLQESQAHRWLDGWLTNLRTRNNLIASSYAFSLWDSLSVSALTVGSFKGKFPLGKCTLVAVQRRLLLFTLTSSLNHWLIGLW